MEHIKNWRATNNLFKNYCKQHNDAMADSWRERLDAADKAPKITEIKIRVLYRRGHEGVNATATLWLTMEDEEFGHISAYGYGHAGGGGYDKASAAVNEAMWFGQKRSDTRETKETKALARAAVDRFVIEHGPVLWKEYCIDMSPVPHFNFAGKGMGTVTRLFRRIGFKYPDNPVCKDYLIDYDESAECQDTYHIVRKDII
jgi:hypothetical protein